MYTVVVILFSFNSMMKQSVRPTVTSKRKHQIRFQINMCKIPNLVLQIIDHYKMCNKQQMIPLCFKCKGNV